MEKRDGSMKHFLGIANGSRENETISLQRSEKRHKESSVLPKLAY